MYGEDVTRATAPGSGFAQTTGIPLMSMALIIMIDNLTCLQVIMPGADYNSFQSSGVAAFFSPIAVAYAHGYQHTKCSGKVGRSLPRGNSVPHAGSSTADDYGLAH